MKRITMWEFFSKAAEKGFDGGGVYVEAVNKWGHALVPHLFKTMYFSDGMNRHPGLRIMQEGGGGDSVWREATLLRYDVDGIQIVHTQGAPKVVIRMKRND